MLPHPRLFCSIYLVRANANQAVTRNKPKHVYRNANACDSYIFSTTAKKKKEPACFVACRCDGYTHRARGAVAAL